MSKAYYYCKNFSFKEVNNLFAYATKNPSSLTREQRVARLYKGMLRKLMSNHIHTIRKVNFDRFHDEQYRVRRDFDKILSPETSEEETNLMIEKYELYIENSFEPYAAMHECRSHSNLWGKMVSYGDNALATDHVGFYSNRGIAPEPQTPTQFHEEYPHMVTAWIYDHQYLDATFDYKDLEQSYLNGSQGGEASEAKAALDEAHKN